MIIGNRELTVSQDADFIQTQQDASNVVSIMQSVAKIYPSLANSITVNNAGSVSWALGTKTQIIPVNTITTGFRIIGLTVGEMANNGTMHIFYGDSDIPCGIVELVIKNSDIIQYWSYNFYNAPLIPANSIVKVALATDTTSGETINIKLKYIDGQT